MTYDAHFKKTSLPPAAALADDEVRELSMGQLVVVVKEPNVQWLRLDRLARHLPPLPPSTPSSPPQSVAMPVVARG